jgi:glycosyltransferase involved in cell wall biosynthesis
MILNIIHVITTIELGGAEKQLLILVRNQRKFGHRVTIFYLKGKPELRDAFEKLGVKVLSGDAGFIRSTFILAKTLRNQFHIAHAHLPRSEIILALAKVLSRKTSVLVATRHNSEPFFPKAPVLVSSLVSRLVLQFYAGLVFISRTVEDFSLRNRECKLTFNSKVIHYGYDEELMKFQSPSDNSNREIGRFLFIGRLAEQKNVPILLRAFRKHLETFPGSRLDIYGGGSLETSLRSSVADLDKNIFWRGRSAQIPEIMNKSTCLVLPSKYEGFGLVLLEAMVMGLPILAANTSAMPEVLGRDHPGLYKDSVVESLSGKLNDICNSNIAERIIAYQNQRIQHFNPVKMTHSILVFYHDCISN